MKSGCRSCALAAASSSALGINRRKITHTSTSRWAMPVRSSAPIALRYSASIRAWAHTKLIRQIVLTVIGTELNCSYAASFVMPAVANDAELLSERTSLGQLDRNEAKIAAAVTFADEAAAARAQDAYAVEQDQAVRRVDAARTFWINDD